LAKYYVKNPVFVEDNIEKRICKYREINIKDEGNKLESK